MNHGEKPTLGIVIPCYDEEEVIPMLLDRLREYLSSLDLPAYVLFVDDGSSDRTFELLDAACDSDSRLAVLRFTRNFGHQRAVTAGLAHIRGDIVAVLDADLQDPPEVLNELIAKWREGYEVVYGIRTKRKEGPFLRLAYATYYRLLKHLANIDMPVDAGDFSLMDRKVVDAINRLPEYHRYVRGLRGWVGYRQIGISYERHSRQGGKPKYNFRRLCSLALDGIVSFSAAPMRLAIWVGAFSALFGLLYFAYAIAVVLLVAERPPGWASLAVLIVFFGGIQLLVLGILGEYVGRIFDEVKRRPHYLIEVGKGWASDEIHPEN